MSSLTEAVAREAAAVAAAEALSGPAGDAKEKTVFEAAPRLLPVVNAAASSPPLCFFFAPSPVPAAGLPKEDDAREVAAGADAFSDPRLAELKAAEGAEDDDDDEDDDEDDDNIDAFAGDSSRLPDTAPPQWPIMPLPPTIPPPPNA